MVECAYVFPGQGAQYAGMGKDLYDNYKIAKEVFEQANRVLGFDIAKLCFEGPTEELTKTENCQPAILTVSIAAFKVFRQHNKKFKPGVALGLSLGEYSALVASGAVAFGDAVKLVRSRGQFMEEAARQFPGKMASIIGLPVETVKKISEEAGCEIANLNCPNQVVVSGSNESIEKAADISKQKGATKVILLKVSGAFHSSLMGQAGQALKEEISKIHFFEPEIPVISNVDAAPETKPDQIVENLIDQMSCSTRLEESIRYVASKKIKNFFEIGPGKVLKGLIKRIDPNLSVHNIETSEDIKNLSLNAQDVKT
ncbi:MAG: ACP S-malonyltransferase [Candidatus Omnitrophica bacterium]|nr:ACP S-malonyltransferase [Candidatus Omnitrophota bacterium]